MLIDVDGVVSIFGFPHLPPAGMWPIYERWYPVCAGRTPESVVGRWVGG
jgi:hypothetical protein